VLHATLQGSHLTPISRACRFFTRENPLEGRNFRLQLHFDIFAEYLAASI
jgi:hypothetical protein